MTVIIYRMESGATGIQMVEYGQFDGTQITGKINIDNISRKKVLDKFNKGYWRTSEV